MNNGLRRRLLRAALTTLLLTPATALAPPLLAQQAGAPSSAPHWQGRPGGMPPHNAPPQGTQTQGMPAVGTPGGATVAHAVPTVVPGKKTPSGEQFFIVASVDLQKSQLLLKYPTEVTQLMKVDGSTKFVDNSGQPLKLSDFRAGDTVWVTSRISGAEVTAVHVRKGQMDVADLHRYYLDYAEVK